MSDKKPDYALVKTSVEIIGRVLAGEPPEIQGTIIADVIATFIVGHHPELRDEVLEMLIQLAKNLIPINEKLHEDRLPWGAPPTETKQ